MPIIMSLLGGLLSICGSLVGRVLLALGLSFVTYAGFDTAMTWLLNQIKNNFNAMPVQIISFLAWLWVDKAIGMIFSAYAAALVIKIGSSASLTKLVRKG